MKSNLLSIDCGLQKSLHDLSGFKERLANIDLESFTDDNCNNHADITNGQGLMNEQMLSLKKAVACKQADLEQVLAENNSMAIRIESLEVWFKNNIYDNTFLIFYLNNYSLIILDKIEKRDKCNNQC